MEIHRFKFHESDGAGLTLDIPCERDANGVLESVKHLSYFGEWMDNGGDTYQLAVRPDATVDYGYFGNEGTKRATFAIHGRALIAAAVFEYRVNGDDSDFQITGTYDGDRWHEI